MKGLNDMDDLDHLFATARAAEPAPPAALMARVLADAAREQPRHSTVVVAAPANEGGFWANLAALFGGGGVLAGLGSAAVAGLFLGYVQPSSVTGYTTSLLGGAALEQVDMMPGIDALLAEE